jgi:cytochrome c55X
VSKAHCYRSTALLLAAFAASAAATPDATRQREIVRLVRQDCGSCHGMTLQGGLGPALTPSALQGKPAESLIATVQGGRPGTPMPPWKPFLSESETAWVVEQLLQGFPQ